MSRPTNTTSVDIDMSTLDKDDLLGYVQRNYDPGDVFPTDALEEWAKENGFTKMEA